MKALIVYAHPEPKSFNGAMKDLSVETLRGRGDEVEVTDLYAMRFNAVVAADDFHGERADPEFLSIAAEQTRACERGTLASDIVTEQKKLARAEILILQFPIWWFGMPAILKGWADRVLARGFAYVAGRKYDTGMLRGKTAMIAATTGTSADTYTPDGIDGESTQCFGPCTTVCSDIAVSTSLNLSSPTCRGVSARRFVSATSTTTGRAFSISNTRRGSSFTPPKITARTSG
jgi:NAD(P)H dehydrogenase (quinone)